MHTVEVIPATRAGSIDWHEPIDSVGTQQFSREAMRSLDRWAGVEHYAAFSLNGDSVDVLSAHSVHDEGKAMEMATLYAASGLCRLDPTLDLARRACARGEVSVLRMDPAGLPDSALRQQIYLSQDVCDRVLICGEREGRFIAVSLIRTSGRGAFNEPDMECIRAIADTWVSLVAKHDRMIGAARSADPAPALLRPVAEIEVLVSAVMPTLTRRETQVCARILRGMSTPGIAVDLVVREDSIATYRKRAYKRLDIGTRFELVQLFIAASASAAATRH
jgi:DNA-binding CsgD family transcriptional regulator